MWSTAEAWDSLESYTTHLCLRDGPTPPRPAPRPVARPAALPACWMLQTPSSGVHNDSVHMEEALVQAEGQRAFITSGRIEQGKMRIARRRIDPSEASHISRQGRSSR